MVKVAAHLPLLFCLSLTLPAGGCILAAVAVGAAAFGVVSYHENESWMDYHSDMAQVWTATVAAMREQGLPVAGDPKPNATDGTLQSGEARVIVESQPGNFTRVRAAIGTFDTADNKRKAGLLLEAIKAKLPQQ